MKEDWLNIFADKGALWIHDGNPKRPHALLTKGGHSDGFFNGTKIMQDPFLMGDISQAFYELLLAAGGGQLLNPTWVFGSAYGAMFLAYQMAAHCGALAGFTEPQPDGSMVNKRFDVTSGQTILPVEDVMTTGGTTQKTIAVLEATGARILPVVLVIFNRSEKQDLDSRKIISLVHHPLNNWTPEECPWCPKGSEAIRPKANWSRLTA